MFIPFGIVTQLLSTDLYLCSTNILYDVIIGVLAGIVASCITYVFQSCKLYSTKIKQFREIISSHAMALYSAYGPSYSTFVIFMPYFLNGDFEEKDLSMLFNKRDTAVRLAIERIMDLHTEFNIRMALISDVIKDKCRTEPLKSRLNWHFREIQLAYADYIMNLSKLNRIEYDRFLYNLEFRLHKEITEYMFLFNKLAEQNDVSNTYGLFFIKPISDDPIV